MKSTKKRDLIIVMALILLLSGGLLGISYCDSDETEKSTLSPDSPFHTFTCCILTDEDTYTSYKFDKDINKYSCSTEFIKTRNFHNDDKLKHITNNYMFYRASGNKNGSNLLETKLVVNDLDDAPYALYKFGIFTNKILKNVTNRQKFVLYKGQCRLEVINEVNKILQDIVTYICNPPSFNKIEHWEILGITITIEETQYRSKSEGFEFTLRIRPQDIEPQDK